MQKLVYLNWGKYSDYIGLMEKKMETTTVYWVCVLLGGVMGMHSWKPPAMLSRSQSQTQARVCLTTLTYANYSDKPVTHLAAHGEWQHHILALVGWPPTFAAVNKQIVVTM